MCVWKGMYVKGNIYILYEGKENEYEWMCVGRWMKCIYMYIYVCKEVWIWMNEWICVCERGGNMDMDIHGNVNMKEKGKEEE